MTEDIAVIIISPGGSSRRHGITVKTGACVFMGGAVVFMVEAPECVTIAANVGLEGKLLPVGAPMSKYKQRCGSTQSSGCV